MQIKTIFVSLFLTWTAYDLNLFRRRGEGHASASATATEVSLETGELKEIKRLHRQGNVIPPWLERPPPRLRMKVNHFRVSTKDPRYSDQRKIRRRINNA